MSFYKDQARALAALNKTLEAAHNDKINVKIESLIYQMLIAHPVSGTAVRKQIERFAEDRELTIKNGVLVMSQ